MNQKFEEGAMLRANCHCGAISITVSSKPEYLIDCNCSICRRNGALWSIFDSSKVEVMGRLENLAEYVWGQRTIRTMHCRTCGCTTHWESCTPDAGSQTGVNLRNVEPDAIAGLRVRKFDGANTWKYID